MDLPIGFAKEEARPRRVERVRPEHQRHLPWLGEVPAVDLLVHHGKEDFAARVRVVPADGLRLAGPGLLRQHVPQADAIALREREGWAKGVLAFERPETGNRKPLAGVPPQQQAADLSAAARQGEKGVHHRQPDLVQNSGGALNGKRALRNAPGYEAAFGALIHRGPYPFIRR